MFQKFLHHLSLRISQKRSIANYIMDFKFIIFFCLNQKYFKFLFNFSYTFIVERRKV